MYDNLMESVNDSQLLTNHQLGSQMLLLLLLSLPLECVIVVASGGEILALGQRSVRSA